MGALHLILGCMFSGKSTEVMNIINRNKSINKNILIITHTIDDRYHNKLEIVTHDQQRTNCVKMNYLGKLEEEYNLKEYDIIIIEEGQFFENLANDIGYIVDKYDIDVYISALNGTYERDTWKEISKLIPDCDTITKKNAFCKQCGDGTPAIFTHLKNNEEQKLDSIVVGHSDIYEALCRKHYLIRRMK